MRFWRKKSAPPADGGLEGDAGDGAARPVRPTRPPVKGTKIRLFLQPPGRLARLLELDIPDDGAADGATLRCFEPPPESRGAGESPSKAWAVDLGSEEIGWVREQTASIRLLPVGDRSAAGDGSTVELTVSAGPAEARLTWWMAPPSGWTAAAALVDKLRRWSGEEP